MCYIFTISPPRWFLATKQPKAFSTAATCYCSAEACKSKAKLNGVNSFLVMWVKVRSFQIFICYFTQAWMSLETLCVCRCVCVQWPTSLQGWHGSFVLTFPVCTSKQTATDWWHGKQPHIHLCTIKYLIPITAPSPPAGNRDRISSVCWVYKWKWVPKFSKNSMYWTLAYNVQLPE